jgi:2-polyprenyl-3-methyl-5-hydroxy-6-metoxy-1,4-benzoquinol methylase
MWEDEYISQYLLEAHLSPETDSASRKKSTIIKTIDWIETVLKKRNATILDLGCGPGLYCEVLAERGHAVTGIDFSKRSIEYAQKEAKEKALDIEYIHKNYLDDPPEAFQNKFDLAMMIFCDFDVLVPDERAVLLKNVFQVLKPGGLFIFDTLNAKAPEKMNIPGRSWELENTGFWKIEPYLALAETFHYPEAMSILQQHIVIFESDQPSKSDQFSKSDQYCIYRFWTHYYRSETLIPILSACGFSGIENHENLLPEDGLGSKEMVTFYSAMKQ